VLTNSPLNLPVEFALRRSLAETSAIRAVLQAASRRKG
jgi:hypothetical protein